jgi:hypothetical protein
MTTKFQVFRGAVENVGEIGKRADEFMARVEEARGEYVESHSSVTDYNGGVLFTLSVVYREREHVEPMVH